MVLAMQYGGRQRVGPAQEIPHRGVHLLPPVQCVHQHALRIGDGACPLFLRPRFRGNLHVQFRVPYQEMLRVEFANGWHVDDQTLCRHRPHRAHENHHSHPRQNHLLHSAVILSVVLHMKLLRPCTPSTITLLVPTSRDNCAAYKVPNTTI